MRRWPAHSVFRHVLRTTQISQSFPPVFVSDFRCCCYVIHSARKIGVDEDVTPFAAFVSFSSLFAVSRARAIRRTFASFWSNHTRNHAFARIRCFIFNSQK